MKRKTQGTYDYKVPHLQSFGRPPEPGAKIEAEPDLDLDIKAAPTRQPPAPVLDIAPASEGPIARRRDAPVQSEPQYRPLTAAPKVNDRPVYALAALFAAALAAAPTAFWFGMTRQAGPFQFEAFTFAVLAALGLGLGGLAFALVYSLRQGAKLAAEARHARRQAEEMLQPALLATAGAGSAVEAVRLEIESATTAAAQARHELKTLSEVLASETARLVDAAGNSARTATSLTASMAHEREGLGALAQSLDTQVVQVTEAIGRQARMVAEASDLAEAQIREAEAALAARAADLVAAAGSTTDAARIASEDLSRQTVRLETAGAAVTEQIQSLEEGLAEQRAALVSVSHAMRAEQEDFAAQIESQQAQLSELLTEAQGGVVAVQDATVQSADAVRQLVEEATQQYKALAEAATEEREQFGESALHTVGALSEAIRHQRQELEDESRQAVEKLSLAAGEAAAAASAQAEAARRRVDELGEAAFAAGQKADAVFEARYSEAQALIAQSASLVEEAGLRASERMTAGLKAAHEAAADFDRLLRDVEERAARLPVETQERSDAVKAVVDKGVDQLLGAARKAAEETQAIDAAFQERVRRNYEMLSEAVRLMGVVSGGAATPRTPRSTPSRPAPSTDVAPTLHLRADRNASPDAEPSAEDIGLRPRLRLTPTQADQDVSAVFETSPEAEAALEPGAEADGWTWKDLLSSIDGSPGGPDRLGDKMLEEIGALSIDPAALMPSGRVDQIAAAIQAGDRAGGREVVRKLAPAAVRRLSRRVLTDIALRSQTDRFLQRYEALIAQASERDPDGAALAEILTTDHGRAFLLIDTAVGGIA